jgi:hypothetical protein
MQIFKGFDKRRLTIALLGGVACLGLYKLYSLINNSQQLEDSNLLVSSIFALVIAAFIYAILKLIHPRG